MSLAAVLLAPLVLLFPAAGVAETSPDLIEVPAAAPAKGEAAPVQLDPSQRTLPSEPAIGWIFSEVAESFRAQPLNQVRIEQHMTIRISPRSPQQPLPPNFLLDLPQREIGPRFTERNIGRCLSVGAINGVQVDAGNNLILFLRDRRMISATLERACRARDFYSGFYIERSSDGQLCVDRDTLLSRSGVNCKLTRIRQLIEADNRLGRPRGFP